MEMIEVQIAAAVERLVKKHARGVKLSTAVVTAVGAGLTSIRRPGSTLAESGRPRLIPGIPKPGDRVAIASIGGAATVLGVISRAAVSLLDLGAPLVGQVYPLGSGASAATAASNTSNTTYATVRSATWASSDLPNGDYALVVHWDAQFSDSASGSLNLRLTVGATVDTVFTTSVSTARERIGYVRTFTGVTVASGLTVTAEYKRDSGSGTASARNPRLTVFAVRTGG